MHFLRYLNPYSCEKMGQMFSKAPGMSVKSQLLSLNCRAVIGLQLQKLVLSCTEEKITHKQRSIIIEHNAGIYGCGLQNIPFDRTWSKPYFTVKKVKVPDVHYRGFMLMHTPSKRRGLTMIAGRVFLGQIQFISCAIHCDRHQTKKVSFRRV